MQPKESYEIRCKMAEMHDEMQDKLDDAMEAKRYVEVSWLCYSIMEQRITRMIEKHISHCPKNPRSNRTLAGISTRLECLKKLINKKYGAYANVDHELIVQIKHWCKERNILVHALLSLNTYKDYDEEFKRLAECGYPLVKKLYVEAGKVRDWSRENEFETFPKIKCRCKDCRCIYEE